MILIVDEAWDEKYQELFKNHRKVKSKSNVHISDTFTTHTKQLAVLEPLTTKTSINTSPTYDTLSKQICLLSPQKRPILTQQTSPHYKVYPNYLTTSANQPRKEELLYYDHKNSTL